MKKKLLSLSSLLIGFWGFSQTEVYFKYDEAGNQRYRGTNASGKKDPELIPIKLEEQVKKTVASQQAPVMDEKTFMKN
ncbi:hypothetical protein FE904_22465, partial [Chryseobacterium indologenes]